MAKNWTEEEEDHIRAHFLTQTYGELAEHFGVTTKAMESKIRRLGLKKQEMLAEPPEPPRPEPAAPIEELRVPQEPSTTPIERIHKLQRRTEVYEETAEERAVRLESGREAAATEKARREEARAEQPVAKALRAFEAGVKKLHAGKLEAAAERFQAILDDPPADVGLVTRARQYLAATEAQGDVPAPSLKSADDYYNYGVMQLNDGDIEGALATLEQAADKAPNDDRVSYVQAIALAQSGDLDAALAALAKAIATNEVARVYARNDSDFGALHGHAGFQALVAVDDDNDAEQDDGAVGSEVPPDSGE